MMFTKNTKVSTGSQQHTAFTLAEVLIVLGILGVVAAMTIPTLVGSYQNKIYATSLKKGYTQFQSSFSAYLADQGVSNIGDSELFDGNDFNTPARRQKTDEMIRKYFKVAKSCVYNDTSCDYTVKYMKLPTTRAISNSNNYIFQTTDGIMYILGFTQTCSPDFSKPGKMKKSCGILMVDSNGSKGPNIMGKDYQQNFFIGHDGTLFPNQGMEWALYAEGNTSGLSYWKNNTNKLCGSIGSSTIPDGANGQCISRIMEENWEINYK